MRICIGTETLAPWPLEAEQNKNDNRENKRRGKMKMRASCRAARQVRNVRGHSAKVNNVGEAGRGCSSAA